MQVQHSYTVQPTRLFAVLTDIGYLTERSRRYGGDADPGVERLREVVIVTTVRRIPVDKVPSVAQRYVGDGRIVQIDRWTEPSGDDTVLASLTVDAGRMPLQMTGRHEIRPAATGCLYVISVDLAVKVPVVGRAIRGVVATEVEKLLAAEMVFTESWLAEHAN